MTLRWLNSQDANVMKILFISLCLATVVPVIFSTVGGYLLWRVGYFGDYGMVEEEAPLE